MASPTRSLLPWLAGAGFGLPLALCAASPAEAVTYWIRNGAYDYNGASTNGDGTFSGYFNWNGTALSGGSLTVVGYNPLVGGGTSTSTTTYSNVAYDPTRGNSNDPNVAANVNSPIALIFFNESGSNVEPGFRISISAVLPTTNIGDESVSIASTASLSNFSPNFSDNNTNIVNNQIEGRVLTTSRTNLTSVSGSIKAPAPISALMLAPIAALVFFRKRFRSLPNGQPGIVTA